MSKYNNMKSILINDINKAELNQAIKEWAEGNEVMEKLLWLCYEHNIQTTGCHVGNYSYLSFHIKGNEEIKLLECIELDNVELLITPDGGNPYSGKDFYIPEITIIIKSKSKKYTEEHLNKLCDYINSNPTCDLNLQNALLDLINHFGYKESGLDFRLTKQNKNYKFCIKQYYRNNSFKYYNELFTKIGFILNDEEIFKTWSIESDKGNIISVIKNIIISCQLDLLNEADIDSFTSEALFRRRTINDEKEFQKWLDLKRENKRG